MRRLLAIKPLHYLLVLFPVALAGAILGWSPLLVFAVSALAIIPLAELIGESTEALAQSTGPRIGGLLNATLGNAAELIITIVAIREGLLELVKASITGSIIGNLLFVLGLSFLLGGLKNGAQRFDQRNASGNAVLLALAVVALGIPSLFSHSIGPVGSPQVETLSLGVAGAMIVVYGLGLLHSLRAAESPLQRPSAEPIEHRVHWSARKALTVLALATLGVVVLSETLVGSVEPVIAEWGVSEFFLGIVLIPIVGNIAEHLVAVEVAVRRKMDLSVEIALGSSLQIALFVAPLLVFLSLAIGNPLTLEFNQFELLALVAAVVIAALVAADGESNWLEGAELLMVYAILVLAFFLLPSMAAGG